MISEPIIQSCIVFIFLTVFFFSYVSSIEKDEFENQLNIIVDDIYNEYKSNIISLFPEDKIKKDILKTSIYGIIDNIENKIEINNQNENSKIDNANQKIIYNSIYVVIGYIILCLIIIFIFKYIGININIKENVKESLFILIFIFLIEFLFLNIIAKNYISGNANNVLKKICTNIIQYINKR